MELCQNLNNDLGLKYDSKIMENHNLQMNFKPVFNFQTGCKPQNFKTRLDKNNNNKKKYEKVTAKGRLFKYQELDYFESVTNLGDDNLDLRDGISNEHIIKFHPFIKHNENVLLETQHDIDPGVIYTEKFFNHDVNDLVQITAGGVFQDGQSEWWMLLVGKWGWMVGSYIPDITAIGSYIPDIPDITAIGSYIPDIPDQAQILDYIESVTNILDEAIFLNSEQLWDSGISESGETIFEDSFTESTDQLPMNGPEILEKTSSETTEKLACMAHILDEVRHIQRPFIYYLVSIC
jgi:hypothetical protein